VTALVLPPTPLEVAVGSVIGREESVPPLPPAVAGLSPRAALEHTLVAALERPPCAVTFSGGRDSSLLLAVAVAVARREGLDLPVPVSARFVNAPGTGEAEWQDLVVAHLGLRDWVRVELEDELDLIGPRAAATLRRHGVLHPPHAGLFALLAECVHCRSLVTGFGGDQLLGGWIGARQSPRLSRSRGLQAAGVVAYATATRRLRRLVLRGDVPDRPWLTEPARGAFARCWLEAASSEPARWDGYVRWLARRRTMASVQCSLELVLGESGVLAFHPLLDRSLLATLASAGGRAGLGNREALLRLLAGDDLPEPLLVRQSKAHFHHAYFRGPSRAFAKRWDGSGLDPAIVDAEELRRAWLGRMPRGSSALALQAAWLSAESRDPSGGRELEQPAGRLGEKLQAARTS